MFEDLAGQVAVITGGARGLGFSMAQALARWGTKIALLDVLTEVKDSAETVQHEFAVECVGVPADVTGTSSGSCGHAIRDWCTCVASQECHPRGGAEHVSGCGAVRPDLPANST